MAAANRWTARLSSAAWFSPSPSRCGGHPNGMTTTLPFAKIQVGVLNCLSFEVGVQRVSESGRKQRHLATVEWRPDCQRGYGLSRYADLRLFCLEFPLCLKPVTDVVAWVVASFEVDFVGSESHVIFRNGRSLQVHFLGCGYRSPLSCLRCAFHRGSTSF